MEAIKYKHGKMKASITRGRAGYLMFISYNHVWVVDKWYTRLRSAKRGLKRTLNDIAFREIASVYRCDLSLVISQFEIDLLISYFKVDKSILFYLPFTSVNAYENMVLKFPLYEARKHFVSIGNFFHQPNLDSVKYLKTEILFY